MLPTTPFGLRQPRPLLLYQATVQIRGVISVSGLFKRKTVEGYLEFINHERNQQLEVMRGNPVRRCVPFSHPVSLVTSKVVRLSSLISTFII